MAWLALNAVSEPTVNNQPIYEHNPPEFDARAPEHPPPALGLLLETTPTSLYVWL